MITLDTSTVIVYGFLTGAVLSIWLPQAFNRAARIPVWMVLCGVSAGCGLYYGIVEPLGIFYLAVLAFACHLTAQRRMNAAVRILSALAILGLVLGLFLHKVPFFNNPLVFDGFFLSPRSAVYTKYWNFDKAAAGLILLAFFGDVCRSRQDWKTLARKSYKISIITVSLSLLLALILGHIEPDVTLTAAFPLWAWSNLFFTCIPEEMLFRGFIQKHLAGLATGNALKTGIVIFVGILFGLAHFGGGAVYMILATIAGLGYGYAYHVTGRIESSILIHFLLNTVHFLFFTYPYARAAV